MKECFKVDIIATYKSQTGEIKNIQFTETSAPWPNTFITDAKIAALYNAIDRMHRIKITPANITSATVTEIDSETGENTAWTYNNWDSEKTITEIKEMYDEMT